MADSTVDALTAASALDGTEEYYAVQGGADRKVTSTQIKTFAIAGLSTAMTIGDPVTSGTSGSVLFVDGSGDLAQDNANFNWVATSHVLTLGAASAVTTSSPVLDASQTWNNSLVAFTGIRLNITDTASSAGSILQDWQVDGSSVFSIDTSGDVTTTGYYRTSTVQVGGFRMGADPGGDGAFQFTYNSSNVDPFEIKNSHAGGQDWFFGDGAGSATPAPIAAGTFSFYNNTDSATSFGCVTSSKQLFVASGTTATMIAAYNTYDTSAGLTYERGVLDWTQLANVLTIGTQELVGSARNMQFVVGGVKKLDYGVTTFGTWTSAANLNITTPATGALKIGTVSSGDGLIQFSYADASNDPIQMKNTTGGEWYIGDGAGTSVAAPFGSNVFALACRFNGPTLGVDSTNNLSFICGGTTAQAWHVYNTYTNSTNYERGMLDWKTTSNTFRISTKAAGTGTVRIIALDGFAKAGAPANTDLPSGTWALIDDTSGNATWLVFNNGGTIRKVQLT